MTSKTKLVALAALLAAASAARATPPAVITYSGFLTDSAGNPVTATSTLHFRFYDASGGGNLLGTQDVSVIAGATLSSEGYFSVVLGGAGFNPGSSPSFSAMFAGPVFMSIAFAGEAEMAPRIQLTSVPSAVAVDWSGVVGRPTGLTCPPGAGFVIGEDVNANPICAAAPGGLSCATNQILKWSGSAWACADDAGASGMVTSVGATAPLASSGGNAPTLSLTGCGLNQILKWNGSAWACADDASGGGTVTSVAGTCPEVSSGAKAPSLSLTTSCGFNQILKWNGSAWACANDVDTNSGGTVTGVTATAPLASSGGAAPNLTITQASSTASGYLSSADWSTFNAKQGRTVAPTCTTGQYLRSIAADGTPTCATDLNSGGTITGVTAGSGLTGGGSSGSVTVSASFGGSGSATTVARSDHDHGTAYAAAPYGVNWGITVAPPTLVAGKNYVNHLSSVVNFPTARTCWAAISASIYASLASTSPSPTAWLAVQRGTTWYDYGMVHTFGLNFAAGETRTVHTGMVVGPSANENTTIACGVNVPNTTTYTSVTCNTSVLCF